MTEKINQKQKVAESNAELAKRESEALRIGEVAKANLLQKFLKAEKQSRISQIRKDTISSTGSREKRIEVEAEAEAEKIRRRKGKRMQHYLSLKAESRGLQSLLEAKAAGYQRIISASNGDPGLAATF